MAYTVSIGDLILNACALEIVKQVDDLIFEAVFSYDVGVILENTRFWIEKINSDNSDKRSRLARKASSLPTDTLLGKFCAHTWLMQLLRCFFIAAVFGFSISQFLAPFVGEIKDVEFRMCGEDLDFTVADHPITDLPVFAALVTPDSKNVSNATELGSETLGCYETAKREVRTIRAGFPSNFSTMERSDVRNGAMERSMSEMHGVVTTNAEGYYKSAGCQDNDFFMSVLQSTCAGSEQIKFKDVPFFHGRTRCADFKPLCGACPNAAEDPDYPEPPDSGMHWYDCFEDNFTNVIANYSVPFAWILKLQQICPKSCNRCRGNTLAAGGPGGGASGSPGGLSPSAGAAPDLPAGPGPAAPSPAASPPPLAGASPAAPATPAAPSAPATPLAPAAPVVAPAGAPAAPGPGPTGGGPGGGRRLSDSADILQLRAENQAQRLEILQLRQQLQDLDHRFAAIEGRLLS